MIGNCFFFKKDDNTKMKKNASFFRFFLGKERGRIFPCWPIIGILADSCVIICRNQQEIKDYYNNQFHGDTSKSVNQLMSTDKIQFINVALLLKNAPVTFINVKLQEVCTFEFVNLQ